MPQTRGFESRPRRGYLAPKPVQLSIPLGQLTSSSLLSQRRAVREVWSTDRQHLPAQDP